GHHFDRQAAVKIGRRLEIVKPDLLASEQRVDKGLVLRACQRTIDVIGAGAGGPGLVVARLEPGDTEVDRVAMHDWRDGVEEGKRCFAGKRADRIGKRGRCERTGGDDNAVPVCRWLEYFLPANFDERFTL